MKLTEVQFAVPDSSVLLGQQRAVRGKGRFDLMAGVFEVTGLPTLFTLIEEIIRKAEFLLLLR